MKERSQADLPHLGAATADTHAHLGMLDDPAGALERATVAGVTLIATVADVTEAPLGTFDELPVWLDDAQDRLDEWDIPHGSPPDVRIIVGVHPHNAKGYTGEVASLLRELARDERVVAVGECGLDYHYDYSSRDEQKQAFAAQLELAGELGLPVAVHLREAHADGMEILRSAGIPKAGCLIHCFTEGPKTAEKFLELGCYVAFGGVLTFADADKVRLAAQVVPEALLLAETDAPFMTPVPFRGRSNEPAWVNFTVAKLAEVRGADTAHLAAAIRENAERLFRVGSPVAP